MERTVANEAALKVASVKKEIDAIEKQKAIVNYGAFTTQVSLDLLELVKSAKKVK